MVDGIMKKTNPDWREHLARTNKENKNYISSDLLYLQTTTLKIPDMSWGFSFYTTIT
ncbi:hypothetical protein FEDK69T_18040 [Flavobacterium enshiense DK69]|nr:hypothetical protein FEDK69T_18040 [Flavobacterium enshiense DK69]